MVRDTFFPKRRPDSVVLSFSSVIVLVGSESFWGGWEERGDRTKTQRQFAHGALYSNHLKAFTKENISECTTCTLAELVGNHGTQGTARA